MKSHINLRGQKLHLSSKVSHQSHTALERFQESCFLLLFFSEDMNWSLQLVFCLPLVKYQRISMSNNAFSFREHSYMGISEELFVCVYMCVCACTFSIHDDCIWFDQGKKSITTVSACSLCMTGSLGTLRLLITGHKWYRSPPINGTKISDILLWGKKAGQQRVCSLLGSLFDHYWIHYALLELREAPNGH